MNSTPLTFGVEEEFLTLNNHGQPTQLDLQRLQQETDCPAGQWSIEAHICMLEHGTPIFHCPADLSTHLIESRRFLTAYCQRQQLQLFAGGTHPHLDWRTQALQPHYRHTATELQQLLEQLLTLGMHCHIGNCPSAQLPALFNAWRPFLAPLLAICANSRSFAGRDTGLASYRSVLLAQLPRAGTPAAINSVADEMAQIHYLLEHGLMEKPNSVWTDARLHPRYQTIEIRVMDLQTNPRQSAAIAVLISCLSIFLYQRICQQQTNVELADWQLRENRWQAVRHGKAAKFIWQGEVLSCQAFWQHWLTQLEDTFARSHTTAQWLDLQQQLQTETYVSEQACELQV